MLRTDIAPESYDLLASHFQREAAEAAEKRIKALGLSPRIVELNKN